MSVQRSVDKSVALTGLSREMKAVKRVARRDFAKASISVVETAIRAAA